MQVQSLFIYPVKSLAGIAVDSVTLDDFGPSGDRRWMVVDGEGHFVTQRTRPELALIKTALTGSGSDREVTLDIPGEGTFTLQPGDGEMRVLVWRDWVKALRAQPGPSEALSRFCGDTLSLVYMPGETFRRVDASRVAEYRRVGFADGYPFLIVNDASLEELNGRLERPVDIRRFRPNIVVTGAASAWEEDGWRNLVIGDVPFSLVKPCSRCVMTTVDPDAGTKAPDLQPLRTLGTYRRTGDGVIFGMNAIHEGQGELRVGNPVTLINAE